MQEEQRRAAFFQLHLPIDTTSAVARTRRERNWNFAQGEDGDVHAKQPVLGRLALVYADHPDFDPRWVS